MNKKFLLLLLAASVTLLACDLASLVSDQLRQVQPGLQTEPTEEPVAVQPTLPSAAQPKTKAPVSGNSGGNLFAGAIEKAKSAAKYRVEFAMIFGATKDGKYSEEAFLNFKGQVDGQNSQLTSQGGILAILSGGGSLEIIQAGKRTYMRGVSLFGQTDPKVWYYTDDQSNTSGFESFAKPDNFKDFTGAGDAADFKKARSEPLDGVACDVYVWDFKTAKNAAIIGLLGSVPDKDDFSAIDRAEMSVWQCADGYVHKFNVTYEGHNAKAVNEKAALKMSTHVWDFGNAAISVQPPKDAKPMPK